ncbi:hypothetical protein C900_01436 [Fulvivirga imtechensis AK7]|uniref:Aerotolerance regulator N-terminal domain-containing protein n=1 Tax=Fulvivirga imtechensis AK7 TaxID=1237149 RepID=L8JXQ2_9BACT|nr:BatA domain-containing protein [Fulvivirga imtechensis]ELR73826.1 hypothetical protein C900_01436 [Fulvivirga imtechensis AK7]
MTFLYPTYLWSLLVLAVPVGIHLWSKKEGKVIKVGSIEFFGASDTKKSSSVKLNELVLFMLRCLIITVLSILLAEPVLRSKQQNQPVHYLIEPALVPDESVSAVIDTLLEKYPVSYLADGFPAINAGATPALMKATPNYWQLASQMEQLYADSIVIFTRARLSGLKGKRSEGAANVTWIVFEPDSTQAVVGATRTDHQLRLKLANSARDHLSFEERTIPLNRVGNLQEKKVGDTLYVRIQDDHPWVPVAALTPKQVVIAYETDFSDDMKLVHASLQAIERYLERPVNIKTVNVTEDLAWDTVPDLLVWMSNSPLREKGIKNIIYKPDPLAQAIITDSADPAIFNLTGTMYVEEAIRTHLTEHLLKVIDVNAGAMVKAEAVDARAVDMEALEPVIAKNGKMVRYDDEDISPWFWMLLVVTVIGERALALYRKQ